MGYKEEIYDQVPIFMQNIMCSVKGFQNTKKRYGKEYWRYRNFLKQFDTWSYEKQLKYQQNEMRKFLRYAVDNSEFYAKLYKDIDIEEISSVENLKKLPLVDKEMLRNNINQVFTIPRKNAVEGHTGGTTGKSLVVRYSQKDFMQRMAMLDHFKARLGFENRRMKRATFNGKHIIPPTQKKKVFWRYNMACRQMIYSSFHLTEKNIGYYVESLNRYKPDALDGFFTSMCDVASYIERHQLKVDFKPIAIFPTSETLTKSGRDLLERVFQCKVYDQYASSEGAPFVTEDKDQKLHMELSTGIFEHISKDSDEVVVTSFTTHGTPLIRYRIGDSMKFDTQAGSKGCVEEIKGRSLDFLYTSEGAKINAGNVSNLMKNLPNIVTRAQFHQKRMNEITVLLEVDKEKYTKRYEKILRDEFYHKFGSNMNVIIKVVDEIPREKSGKFRMIVNRIEGV